MPDPALSGLAARLDAIADELADIAAGGDTPAGPGVPAVPTGLRSSTTPHGLRLDWDPVPAGVRVEVRDEANPADPVKDLADGRAWSLRSAMKPGSAPRRYVLVAVDAAGARSEPSPALVVTADGSAPTPTPAPAPDGGVQHPYDVLGGDWYLAVPVGEPEHPKTVKLPDLRTYSDEWFHLNETGDGVVFRANCGGVTTKGSNYPRSEYRQTDNGKLATWGNAGAGQTFTVEEAFTRLPVAKPEVVGFQIHDAADDVIEGHLSGTHLAVKYADGKKELVLDEHYELGTRFRVQIVAANGAVRVFYNDRDMGTLPLTGSGWYWKVGAYVQSNPSRGDKPDAVGEVVVYRADVTRN